MGNPTYITQTSTGSSPWFSVNWHDDQLVIGIAVRATAGSTGWQVDVTMDDPFGTFPSPAGPTVFPSTACAGGGITPGSTTGGLGAILSPIAALRLTNNSASGAATLTVLQSGIA